jgi:hypothetical protein
MAHPGTAQAPVPRRSNPSGRQRYRRAAVARPRRRLATAWRAPVAGQKAKRSERAAGAAGGQPKLQWQPFGQATFPRGGGR